MCPLSICYLPLFAIYGKLSCFKHCLKLFCVIPTKKCDEVFVLKDAGIKIKAAEDRLSWLRLVHITFTGKKIITNFGFFVKMVRQNERYCVAARHRFSHTPCFNIFTGKHATNCGCIIKILAVQ